MRLETAFDVAHAAQTLAQAFAGRRVAEQPFDGLLAGGNCLHVL